MSLLEMVAHRGQQRHRRRLDQLRPGPAPSTVDDSAGAMMAAASLAQPRTRRAIRFALSARAASH